MLANRLDDAFGIDIATQVDDVETVVLQQHLHDVLADIVDIALHRRDDDAPLPLAFGSGCELLHDIKAHLHRLGRGHELGKEELAAFE